MSELPRSWAEIAARMARLFGGPSFEAEAWEWIRQAVEAKWGVTSLHGLDRGRRQLAFQKASGALLALLDEPVDFAFGTGTRPVVARVFGRYFDGACLAGPPWRVDPAEAGLPAYVDWVAAADFAAAVSPSRKETRNGDS